MPPWLSDAEVVGREVVCLWSRPLRRGLPLPLQKIGNGGCHRALDRVPWMGFGAQLLVDVCMYVCMYVCIFSSKVERVEPFRLFF